jgi:hypothetical protein
MIPLPRWANWKPSSGKFVARIDSELHRAIAAKAAQTGMSLIAFVTQVFQRATEKSRRPRNAKGKKRHRRTLSGG